MENVSLNGCLLSPYDERDYKAKDYIARGSIPDEFCETDLEVLNQGSVGSCVAHAIASYKYIQSRRNFAYYLKLYTLSYSNTVNKILNFIQKHFSTDFIYHNRGINDYQGEGMYVRQALSQLCKYGDCEFKYLPTNTHYPNSITYKRVQSAKDNASSHLNDIYYRCEDDEDIKETIYETGGCLLVINSTKSFKDFRYSKDGMIISMPTDGEEEFGNHCVLAVGYNKDGIIIQNSWGTIWGNKGLGILPYGYPILEAWGCTNKLKEYNIIELPINSKTATFNGEEIELDVPAKIENGRTLVPLRFIAEILGCEVEYIAEEDKVVIISNKE